MRKINIKYLIIFFTLVNISILAQRSDPNLQTVGLHTGNRVGISFHNDGQIAGILSGVDIRGEWPLGSGENYIGDMIPLIGAQFINKYNDTISSVIISRGPRNRQAEERHPVFGYFWGWNPMPGFRNPNYESIAMSHLPRSWPIEGWNDEIAKDWKDEKGVTQWFGYFGRGIKNADQESIFDADDQWDDEFNFLWGSTGQILDTFFLPNQNDLTRRGMGLRMRVRGFQWSNFLAEDAVFWLYDIQNEGTYTYRKADFGTVVGTLAGGDGDSGDDLGYFDIKEWVTYSWDSDGIGNKGQKVGYVGYAFLESPGNPFDGIDNDDDSRSTTSPRFVQQDFDSVIYNAGDKVVLIDPITYERTLHTVSSTTDTVYSLGVQFIIEPGVTIFREGHIGSIVNGVSIPHPSAYDGIDNDLDGLIDENQAIHYTTRIQNGELPLRYRNYRTGAGLNDLLIDERRDNDIDEDGDWDPLYDDVGIDGLGPNDDNYPGPDFGEGNGVPDQGEPNFGRTDPDESDQIGLTSFNFFNLAASPDMTNDTLLWSRMTPGRFDVIPPIPQDGDFIYASGYFPLVPMNGNREVRERFSVSILFGEDLNDIIGNKQVVQQIYNSNYKFPQPPVKPHITIAQDDGKVVIYWDGRPTENSRDFITKRKDFQGYKIYRATDANFTDSRQITNARGILSFDRPIAQYDLIDSIRGYFHPSRALLEQVGGTTFYLGENTGVINKFIDSNVVLGQTYYYAVSAYDSGDELLDIFPTENSKFIRRTSTGQIITDDNTGYITPGARPVGYVPAQVLTFDKSPNFRGTGTINVEMVDDKSVRDGFRYEVAFQDTGLVGNTISWSLIDLQTPDTVYVPATGQTFIVDPNVTINLPFGADTIYVNGIPRLGGATYTGTYDTLVNKFNVFNGNTPTFHGFRMQIYNDATIKLDSAKSGFEGVTTDPLPNLSLTLLQTGDVRNYGIATPFDYEMEFYNSIVDTSIADTLFPKNLPSNRLPAVPVNFKVKNISKGEYVKFTYFKVGTITTTYTIDFKEDLNNDGELERTWRVIIRYNGSNVPLETQGKVKITTLKPFSRDDKVIFKMKSAEINSSAARNELDEIKVVPNPYVVTHEAESRLLSTQTSGRGEREIRFTHIPPGAKISIFTVRGELIKTLYHEDLYVGDVYWNLRTEENLDVAYGVYVFVVEAGNVGKKVGKFALIK